MKEFDILANKIIERNQHEIIDLRREFHKYPELGFQEFKTSRMIWAYLDQLELDDKSKIAGTGVVVDVNPHIMDYCIALRFDIDALPIAEETDLEFASKHSGNMHGCGHDGHIAIGLGLAKLLKEVKDLIPARIRLIFQPAEEGLGGAKKMIDGGALSNPTPNLIIGLHIWPYLNSGCFGIKSGPIMAAGDKYFLKFIGKEGHGSSPHLAVDPTIMTAEVIQGFQNIIGRVMDPVESAVISVGTIHGGNSFNTIPSFVEITGTTRFTDMELRKKLEEKMTNLIKGIAISNGATYEFNYEKCFDVTTSDKELVEILRSTINETVGEGKIIDLEGSSMASEDFSEYEHHIPGLYFFLGTMNKERDCIYPLHNSKYNLDEEVLPCAVKVLGNLVRNISIMRAKEALR